MSRQLRRLVLFVSGLFFVLLGMVLIVLPGPLTIPPILLGVWLWSLEFEFAQRLMRPIRVRGSAAWESAKEKPFHTGVVTALGLIGAAVLIWAALRFDAFDRGRAIIGLG